MLYLIPPPIHRMLYRGAHRLRTIWFRLRRGTITGCSMIAQDEEGRVLLVRHSYGHRKWTFPGGGVRSSEDPALAASREFEEELGCLFLDVALLGTIEAHFHGATNRVHVYRGAASGTPRPDTRELTHARFFAPDDLPKDLSATVRPRLALLLGEGQNFGSRS